jgi:hypothetical protein
MQLDTVDRTSLPENTGARSFIAAEDVSALWVFVKAFNAGDLEAIESSLSPAAMEVDEGSGYVIRGPRQIASTSVALHELFPDMFMSIDPTAAVGVDHGATLFTCLEHGFHTGTADCLAYPTAVTLCCRVQQGKVVEILHADATEES